MIVVLIGRTDGTGRARTNIGLTAVEDFRWAEGKCRQQTNE
jgi:hypothetical protein